MEELLTEAQMLVKSGELITLHRQYATGEIEADLKQRFEMF
jgi:histidine ammonia-lyase